MAKKAVEKPGPKPQTIDIPNDSGDTKKVWENAIKKALKAPPENAPAKESDRDRK